MTMMLIQLRCRSKKSTIKIEIVKIRPIQSRTMSLFLNVSTIRVMKIISSSAMIQISAKITRLPLPLQGVALLLICRIVAH